MVVFDLLKDLQTIIVLIEDSNWNAIVGSMFPSSAISATSAVQVNIDHNPETAIPGQRSIGANIQSDDPLDRILSNSIDAYTLSLRLQRSGQDNVQYNRGNLCRYIRTINNRMGELVDWYDDCMTSDITGDAKLSVRDAYRNCMNTIVNFNDYVIKINNGESDVLWTQPDNGARIPSLTPLPAR